MRLDFDVYVPTGGGRERLIDMITAAVRAVALPVRPGTYEIAITRSDEVSDRWQRVSENGMTAHVWQDFVIRRSKLDDGWLVFRSDRVMGKHSFLNEAKKQAADIVKGDAP